ncbi:MAG: SDR family oxidoreductase [Planctomycetales bacterium]|nr:SDR family oxidoreductase [Planctomycetales bacterium]
MSRLANQVALITGGGTGIGRATALLFAEEGAAVAVNYSKSRSEAEQTVAEIQAAGGTAIAVQANVADDRQVRRMCEQVYAEFSRLDQLVNNAATTSFVSATDLDAMDEEKWDSVLNVNVKGLFYVSRAAIQQMRKGGGGHIVNVSSIAAYTGQGSSIAYSASKAAVLNMTKAMAFSQAPDVRINAVAPGVVETRWIAGWEKFTDPHKQLTPLQRHATPEDVALAIFGLAINPFITGKSLVVDGGRTLRC